MPRGRHRHSPPLHRLLPPSAIAGVSLVCAFGPWVFSERALLRVIAAFAAATAVVGAAVMRRWDAQAGKQVADLTRARASDEWRYEERVAELEADLDESRELRAKLEQRLRAKRSELAGLRNEHAALLRRYATAETERASALEGRRLLEIEATAPARALPPVPEADTAPEEEAEAVAAAAEAETATEAETSVEADTAETAAEAETATEAEADGAAEAVEEEPATPAVFSPEGSRLFLRANEALSRLDDEAPSAEDAPDGDGDATAEDAPKEDTLQKDASQKDAPEDEDDTTPDGDGSPAVDDAPDEDAPVAVDTPNGVASPKGDGPSPKGAGSRKSEPVKTGAARSEAGAAGGETEAAQEDEAQGQPEAADGHEHAAATPTAKATQPVQQPSGHFVAPTAVAVVPAAPVRRPAVEGGFDFFGTQKGAASEALEAVQNEDLADVVGQEALALHKAESEAEFKPADEESRGAGQVIDLTAHDETEQIDVQGLRSVVS